MDERRDRTGTPITAEDWRKQLNAICVELHQAFAAQNVIKLADLHTDDTAVMPPGYSPCAGRDGYIQLAESAVKMPVPYLNKARVSRVIHHTDTTALAELAFIVQKSRKSPTLSGKGLWAARREGGKTRIAVAAWNYDSTNHSI